MQLRVWATLWFQLSLGDLNPAAEPFSTPTAAPPPPAHARALARPRGVSAPRPGPAQAGGGAARGGQVEAGPGRPPSCLPLRPWIGRAPLLVCAWCWATSAAARPGLSYPLGCAGLRLEGWLVSRAVGSSPSSAPGPGGGHSPSVLPAQDGGRGRGLGRQGWLQWAMGRHSGAGPRRPRFPYLSPRLPALRGRVIF